MTCNNICCVLSFYISEIWDICIRAPGNAYRKLYRTYSVGINVIGDFSLVCGSEIPFIVFDVVLL